ncbi:substrate-binding periplasmic protein [Spartinivicinus ruber]|uniref:substrate-binding periplasmic protein n=1 Tax=Spartinivicinus ruber TaxID=2683272 RepID=UPI001CA453FA|nr:transporter substrate-binding domain-containing protein [Spartinivicinus ruber]
MMKYLSLKQIKLFIVASCFFIISSLCIASEHIQIVTEYFPPYSISVDGQVEGISTEVVRAVLNDLKLTHLPIRLYPWLRTYQKALKEKNTLIFSIGRNAKRKKLFKWVGVIAPAKFYIFSLHNRNDISLNSLEDVKQYTLGTVVNDVREQFLVDRGFVKGKEIFTTFDHAQNLTKLLRGRIDLWPMNELAAYYLVKKRKLVPKYTIKKVYHLADLSMEGYYMAFNKDTDDETVNQFRRSLEKIKNEGIYKKIISSYLVVE